MAPSFLSSLVQTKAASAAGVIARATGSSSVTMGSSGGGTYGASLGPVGPWDTDVAIRNGYERVIWIFRAVDVIAMNQAKIGIDLRKGFDRRTGDIIENDRLNRLLNFRANSYETAQQFRYRVSSQALLSRRGVFIEVVPARDGMPAELHILPAGSTEPIPDPKTFVSGYLVRRSDYQVDELTPDQVIWIRLKPHPNDPYAQMTPLVAAGIEADTDFLARIFNRNFLANDGKPGMLITIDGGTAGLNPEDAELIKARFGGGPAFAGQTTVIESQGMAVHDMSATPHDTQWTELLNMSKERLLMAFGVPESVMGNASGRTFDNADAERENFWIDTMMPHCDAIAQGFDPLSGSIDDDTVFGYRYDEVDVLQRVAAARRQEWRDEVVAGLRTIDEYFDACGKEQWNVVGTRVLLWNNIPIARTPQDQAVADKFVPIGAPQMPPNGGGGAGAPTAAAAGAAAGNAAMRQFGNQMSARVLALANKAAPAPVQESTDLGYLEAVVEKAHPYLGTRHRIEGAVEGVILGWDARQQSVIADRLMHVKSRRGTRHWEGEGIKGFPKNQKCKYCKDPATKRVIHSEGMAYVPTCDAHLGKAKDAAARCLPYGGYDEGNIDRVVDVKADEPVETKGIDPTYAVEVDRWVSELKDTLEVVIRDAVTNEARTATMDLKSSGVLDRLVSDGKASGQGKGYLRAFQTPQDAEDAISGRVADVMAVVDTAARNQSNRVARKIEQMDQSGATVKQIEAEVRKMIGTRSQWRKVLAVNAATSAVEGARAAIYGLAGNYITKTWNTEGDERVRATHHALDHKSLPVTDSFKTGDASLRFPGDPLAPAGEVVNCRCWLEYDTTGI